MAEGLEHRDRVGQKNAEGDRHVHVGASVTDSLPCRAVEDPTRIKDRRPGNQRRDQMEHVTGGILGAGPDRHRQKHHVHRGKACDRQRAQKFAQNRIALLVLGSGKVRGITESVHSLHRRGDRLAGDSPLTFCHHRNATRRKIDARPFDTLDLWQFLFEKRDAGTAMHARNDQIALAQTVTDRPAGQSQLVGDRQSRAQGVEFRRAFGSGGTAAHYLSVPSALIWMRWARL